MGRARGLTDAEKAKIVKDMAKGTPIKDIAASVGRHVDTVKRYLADPSPRKKRKDSGVLKIASTRDLRNVKRIISKKPGLTSKEIFNQANLPEISKTTRCRLLRDMGKSVTAEKRPPLSARHKDSRLKWARDHMKTNMQMVLFTDETRATLDGPDGWGKGWVANGQERHTRLRRQQGGGGVMIWAGIIGDELVGPVRVPDGVKITSQAYCKLLESVLLPWLDDVPLAKLNRLIFQHDNAPSHSAKATQAFLSSIGFKGNRLMVWPACSPDLNPIENLWGLLKQTIYKDGTQYTSKEDLWNAIRTSASTIPRSEIKKLTESVDKRIELVLQKKGSYVNY